MFYNLLLLKYNASPSLLLRLFQCILKHRHSAFRTGFVLYSKQYDSMNSGENATVRAKGRALQLRAWSPTPLSWNPSWISLPRIHIGWLRAVHNCSSSTLMSISIHVLEIKNNKDIPFHNCHNTLQEGSCFNIKNVTTHEIDYEINDMTYFPAENVWLSSLS